MISLKLEISEQHKNSLNIWKFNNDLLQNVGFWDQVKSEKLDMSDTSKWEWFTFEAKRIAISAGKEMSHIRKQKQKDLIKKMNSLTNNSQLSSEDEIELKLLQSQLDHIYTIKASGAYIPSRARWIEKGEKSSSYFFGLEKQRQTKRKIRKLKRNDEDQKLIQDDIFLLYSNLYKSEFNKADCGKHQPRH